MDLHHKILLVEDDEALVKIVSVGLFYQGAEVVIARDGEEAVRAHRDHGPDLVLLDIMLPRLDGLSVLRRMRAVRDTPVILLTAKSELRERVAGLEAGADDYVTKPFQFPELVARIRAVLRRRQENEERPREIVSVGELHIDPAAHRVTLGSRKIELTAREFGILELLARNAGRVLPKEEIYEAVWGWEALDNPNVVEQHVSKLRKKLGQRRDRPLIQTIWGVGYVLRDEEEK